MKIAIIDTVWPDTHKLLESSGFIVTSHAEGSDVVVLRSGIKLDMNEIRKLHSTGMRVILRAGSGLDNIDVATCSELGIKVVTFPGYNAKSVAEVTVGFMLVASHRLWEGAKSLTRGQFNKNYLWGEKLANKQIGIIGFGKTGQATADLLYNLGVENIIVYSRTIHDDVSSRKIVSTSLDHCLSADIVSLHVPLTNETRNLINQDGLSKLKKGSILINMARREVVNHAAIKSALLDGVVSSYASDVLDPVLDSDLLDMDNVIGTPHLGAQCESIQKEIAINMQKWLLDWRCENEHF